MVAVPSDSPGLALAAAIRRGDSAAFERLFREWYARLAEYALRLAGNADAAEDAVQDVFVALWDRKESVPDDDKLPAYLHRAVRNRVLNQFRDARTAERWASAQDGSDAQAPAADADVLRAEVRDVVAAALDELPPRTREIFVLSREQGLTYSAIADTLDISVKTVETLMGRALKTLRDKLRRNVS